MGQAGKNDWYKTRMMHHRMPADADGTPDKIILLTRADAKRMIDQQTETGDEP